ncbi:outer membrane protein Iml2/Tetratricopeptide repeat protein 39 [Phlebopus sp. FC_14]|nr:outer membrane protein Iml2/Tetratricopeptide repeat protein 39 [Phlebopus sp. FC_14]
MSLGGTEENLRLASRGFDFLFANDLDAAIDVFGEEGQEDSPFHLMGLGVCAFLKAAVGLELDLMEEATACLALSEAGAKKQIKLAKASTSPHRFSPGMEWEVIHSDAVLLLGLTHALNESYKGYLQCLYELNSAHSKFTKLFKTLYPNGLDAYATPGQTPLPSRKASNRSLRSSVTQATVSSVSARSPGFFARWTGFASTSSTPVVGTIANPPNGPIEELILSGAAFGFGLFNLAVSLLPVRVKSVVGFLGFSHDRQLALQALAVSAARTDVHSVFSGLVLMTYYGVILLVTGYQADQAHIVKQYKGIVNRIAARYPKGALWILNKAKIQRMTADAEGAIETLREGLQPDRQTSFPQADTLLYFELAWTLLSRREYEESAKTFLGLLDMNTWSHATYRFLAAGCYFSVQDYDRAQQILDEIPGSIEKRRGRIMPTEAYIKKKLHFYKKKHLRRGGDSKRFVEAIRISPAEEFAIFWNTHAHIDRKTGLAHIKELSALTPSVGIESEYMPSSPALQTDTTLDLDTPDELAIRSLILGIIHRTLGDYVTSRALLYDALKHVPKVDISQWVGGVAYFELTVLEMNEGERKAADADSDATIEIWESTFKAAKETLNQAHALCTKEVDLSSRLDSRIVMLRDEIKAKQGMLGFSEV